jgi:DNA polymerase
MDEEEESPEGDWETGETEEPGEGEAEEEGEADWDMGESEDVPDTDWDMDEGPGVDEDRCGQPFVGAAGQLLTKIIAAMGLTRETVYICNIVKCRPPNNRNPEAEEIRHCLPFLKRQLAAINPRVICALGSVAARTLLETQTPISRLRGQFKTVMGIPVMPTFHPAYLLRNPEKKREVWNDVQQIMKLLDAH